MATPGVNVSRTVYHGSASFIGNMARRFLKMVDHLYLHIQEKLSCELLEIADKFIKAFKEFDAVLARLLTLTI